MAHASAVIPGTLPRAVQALGLQFEEPLGVTGRRDDKVYARCTCESWLWQTGPADKGWHLLVVTIT